MKKTNSHFVIQTIVIFLLLTIIVWQKISYQKDVDYFVAFMKRANLIIADQQQTLRECNPTRAQVQPQVPGTLEEQLRIQAPESE